MLWSKKDRWCRRFGRHADVGVVRVDLHLKAQRFRNIAVYDPVFLGRFGRWDDPAASMTLDNVQLDASILEGLLADGVTLLAGFELGPLDSIEL